jgi:alpha-2-macroglobulin
MFRLLRRLRLNRRATHVLALTVPYLSAFAVALAVAAFFILRAQEFTSATQNAWEEEAAKQLSSSGKPFFSLATNHTYATTDRARLWLNYRNINEIDFRVYRVKDPVQFFRQLDDPHQVGEDEKEDVQTSYHRTPTLLEKAHALKTWIYSSVKDYVRLQLAHESRKLFNQKFRASEVASRVPLNVADYARVPLLNPDQLVSAWREKLPPLVDEYDRRMIPLGKREPGVYLVEAVNGDLRAYSVAIITDLTLVEKTSENEVLVYAVNRKSGAPRAGAAVAVVRGRETIASGTTNDQGIFKSKIQQDEIGERAANSTSDATAQNSYLIMASEHEDFAISDLDSLYLSDEGEEFEGESSNVVGYIYTDRPVYRPNQQVYFKGILRRLVDNSYQMIGSDAVNVTIEDEDGGHLFEGDVPLSSRGTFSGEVNIPEEAPLGYYRIIAHVGGAELTGYFHVEEYKKPEYKVKVSTPKEFVRVGQTTKFMVEARYFFGAPVSGAEVKYYIYRSRYYPAWWSRDEAEEDDDEIGEDPTADEDSEGGYYYGSDMVDEGTGTLDAHGRMEVEFDVPEPDEKNAWDYTYRIEAQVTDASRRMMPGLASFVGTRGSTIAYAEPEHYIYTEGDMAKIQIKTSDYEGHATPAKVTLKFFERRWEKVMRKSDYDDHEYEDSEVRERELLSVDVTTNIEGEASYDYLTNIPGNIFIKTVINENNRADVSNGGSLWVSDTANQWADSNYEDDGSIKLIPDKKSYQPGETARVLVMLPTDKVHLLVTTELASVMTATQVDAEGRTVVLNVPIESRFEPNVYLNVSYVKDDDLYTGKQNLNVPARDKILKLEIIPNKKEYKPRDTASYTILARNADGTPAPNAEVSLGVVDESIYSVMPETAGDIRREFYGQRYDEVQTSLAISYSFTGYAGDKPIQLARNKPSYQLADFKNESEPDNPAVRRKFKDTAFWQPDVITGADGRATVKVELPDNLTTWRATARAITEDARVGVGVERVVARKDLIIRIEAPRFLTAGDTVTISGIVHNFTKGSKQTRVSLDAKGAQLLDAPTQTFTLPSQGERRVDWRVNVAQAGSLKLLAKALTDAESDAVEIPLEIIPRGIKQTKAATAALPEGNAERSFSLDLPTDADTSARRLRIEAAPSIAGTLFGALDYLTGFPYGCTEQTMSRFLPNVIVAQALKDIPNASLRTSNNLEAKVQAGLDRLYSFQHTDSGWGWWKNDESDPFMTAYVIDGLTLARNAGYGIDGARFDRGRERLKALLDESVLNDNRQLDLEVRAYMIYALNESGEADARYSDDLFANRNELQPYGRALLALTLKLHGDESRALEVANAIISSASVDERGAHWESRRSHIGYEFPEVNDTEATALSLKALAQIEPQSELLPLAARWLVANRRFGHYWDSTRNTAFAIFGLVDYLKVSRELSPDYIVEVYLNGEQILSRHVTAEDAGSAQSFIIERKGRAVGSASRVRVVKRGRGVLYFSATLDYYNGDREATPQASAQLKLTREYLRLSIDDAADKPTWKIEPLTGSLKSGDYVVVRLHVEGGPGQYMMIEDPIPAGCEQVARVSNLNLNYNLGQWGDWYSAREFRDQKTVFFLNNFDGDASFQYAMRVEVPGEFRIAPARAELMYQPSVQSNTGGGRMTILEK